MTPEPGPHVSLLTDHYELTMLHSALRSGIAHHHAVFEVFSRSDDLALNKTKYREW